MEAGVVMVQASCSGCGAWHGTIAGQHCNCYILACLRMLDLVVCLSTGGKLEATGGGSKYLRLCSALLGSGKLEATEVAASTIAKVYYIDDCGGVSDHYIYA